MFAYGYPYENHIWSYMVARPPCKTRPLRAGWGHLFVGVRFNPHSVNLRGPPVIRMFSLIYKYMTGDPLKMAIQALKPLFCLSNF